MTDFLNKLLSFYNINESDFEILTREVDADSFMRDYSFKNISNAINIVKDSVKNNKKIMIYGDYDADGIMGTSILVKMFSYCNYILDYYIPSRYLDGYGINMNQAQKIAENKYDLVICVDNGVSAIEPINYLRNSGIDVVVLDHHEVGETLPNANAIVHPFISELGEYSSSGAFVAFCFSIQFLGRFDKYLSTLAAISLISDSMPLKSYNRDLLRIVIKNYIDGEFKAIDLLKGNEEFNETSIGMQIAPKINSIGRLLEDESVNNVVKYFTTDNEEILLTYFSWMSETNENRKTITKQAYENIANVSHEDGAIVEIVNEKEGIIGLIANSLLNKYKKPSIIFAKDTSGEILKGSCRSTKGFNVVDCFENLKDLMINYGGHALAGGCSITAKNYEVFKKRFIDFANDHPCVDKESNSIGISLVDINMENYEIIKKFSPFGEEWKAPTFNLQPIKTNALTFSRDGKHILTQIGTNSKISGFYINKESIMQKDSVVFEGHIRLSTYRNFTSVEFLVSKYK